MSKKQFKKLGNNIKFARKAKNISQEKLGELIGKTRNYIGMIERAEVNVPVGTVFAIANTLNVEPKALFEF